MWFRPRPDSEAAQAARRHWHGGAPARPDAPLQALRWICIDTETTGLDPYKDSLIALGACAVEADAIALASSMEVFVRQQVPSSIGNVLVHGIGHGAQSSGEPLDEALAAFLHFSGRDVLVGYHSLFDVLVLQRAARQALGLKYRPQHLDVGLLLPVLFGDASEAPSGLDHWVRRLGIRMFARHHALADALATAELFLACLDRVRRLDVKTLGELLALQQKLPANPPSPGGA